MSSNWDISVYIVALTNNDAPAIDRVAPKPKMKLVLFPVCLLPAASFPVDVFASLWPLFLNKVLILMRILWVDPAALYLTWLEDDRELQSFGFGGWLASGLHSGGHPAVAN